MGWLGMSVALPAIGELGQVAHAAVRRSNLRIRRRGHFPARSLSSRERSSKANSVEAIEPEGDVVFYNLPSHNPLISELREMVAGRLFFSEAKKV